MNYTAIMLTAHSSQLTAHSSQLTAHRHYYALITALIG